MGWDMVTVGGLVTDGGKACVCSTKVVYINATGKNFSVMTDDGGNYEVQVPGGRTYTVKVKVRNHKGEWELLKQFTHVVPINEYVEQDIVH